MANNKLELVETHPFAKNLYEPNPETKIAVDDVRKGKTINAASLKELFTNLTSF